MGVALVVLYFFAPGEHRFYPRCVFHALTGWACPGCGSLRAVHNLLHGDFAAAFRLNPLLMILLPGMVLMSLGAHVRSSGFSLSQRVAERSTVRGQAKARTTNALWIWIVLSVIVLFSVLRNLPMAPFSYFKP